MQRKSRNITVLILLTLISFADHQFFYEPERVTSLSAVQRQFMHLLVLLSFIPVGAFALGTQPAAWVNRLWIATYSAAVGILALVGVVQWKLGLFPGRLLDVISSLRIFLTSPLPLMLLLYMAKRILARDLSTPQ